MKSILLLWKLLCPILKNQRNTHRIIKEDYKAKTAEKVRELKEALKAKDWAMVWRLARQLGGKRRGPTNRKLAQPMMEKPTTDE